MIAEFLPRVSVFPRSTAGGRSETVGTRWGMMKTCTYSDWGSRHPIVPVGTAATLESTRSNIDKHRLDRDKKKFM